MNPDREFTVKQGALVASWIVAAVAAAYVLLEHRAHVVEWLPYLLLLACPLMHIFMHRGHGRHHEHRPP